MKTETIKSGGDEIVLHLVVVVVDVFVFVVVVVVAVSIVDKHVKPAIIQ